MGHSRRGAGHLARLGTGLGAVTRKTVFLTATLLASIPASARPSHDQPLYKDPNAPVEQRVEDLLSRMTLEEKIAQITCIWNRKQEILTPSGDFGPSGHPPARIQDGPLVRSIALRAGGGRRGRQGSGHCRRAHRAHDPPL